MGQKRSWSAILPVVAIAIAFQTTFVMTMGPMPAGSDSLVAIWGRIASLLATICSRAKREIVAA